MCAACGKRQPEVHSLCIRCLESGLYVECQVCGEWEVYDTLKYRFGPDLGGWVTDGEDYYCPKHAHMVEEEE